MLSLSANVRADAISDVNTIRLLAGLPALSHSVELGKAAASHAQYLARYVPEGASVQGSAHEQSSGLPEFTGHLAADRAVYFGYPHSQVIENVSLGNQTSEESVSNLMAAIYHRFAFLNPEMDEIGFARAGTRYVYNMGRKDLTQACVTQPVAARVAPPHNCLGQKMKASAYQDLCQNLPEAAHYASPYPFRCPGGALLRSDFMQGVCESPPRGAELKGAGRYFEACNNGLKINANWFEKTCRSNTPDAIYQYSGASYQICSQEVPVHAEWYQDFCASLPEDMLEQGAGTYYNVCTNGFQIKSEYYDRMRSDRLLSLPDAVIWPADGVRNIQPVFYDEDPHPTPDRSMTGYPISIQFNPQAVSSVSIMGFGLERRDETIAGGWRALPDVRRIDQYTDLNRQFSAYQFAWFPLQRLKWGTAYRYQIDALVDGVFKRFTAQFTTTELTLPMYEVDGDTNQVSVAQNHFVLYREADAYDDSPFKSIELHYRNRPFVDINVIDTNTVELNVGGTGCAPVVLDTRMREQVHIGFCK